MSNLEAIVDNFNDDVFRQVFLSQPRHKDVSRAVTYPEPLPSPA